MADRVRDGGSMQRRDSGSEAAFKSAVVEGVITLRTLMFTRTKDLVDKLGGAEVKGGAVKERRDMFLKSFKDNNVDKFEDVNDVIRKTMNGADGREFSEMQKMVREMAEADSRGYMNALFTYALIQSGTMLDGLNMVIENSKAVLAEMRSMAVENMDRAFKDFSPQDSDDRAERDDLKGMWQKQKGEVLSERVFEKALYDATHGKEPGRPIGSVLNDAVYGYLISVSTGASCKAYPHDPENNDVIFRTLEEYKALAKDGGARDDAKEAGDGRWNRFEARATEGIELLRKMLSDFSKDERAKIEGQLKERNSGAADFMNEFIELNSESADDFEKIGTGLSEIIAEARDDPNSLMMAIGKLVGIEISNFTQMSLQYCVLKDGLLKADMRGEVYPLLDALSAKRTNATRDAMKALDGSGADAAKMGRIKAWFKGGASEQAALDRSKAAFEEPASDRNVLQIASRTVDIVTLNINRCALCLLAESYSAAGMADLALDALDRLAAEDAFMETYRCRDNLSSN